ncbi:MAG: class I SAM-dependent methyltransferase [Bryobacteraceae bacterium]
MINESHWDSVYQSKQDTEVSWTQLDPALSLSLIQGCVDTGRVIDIGGGTSPLAGRLLDHGYSVAVMDISQAALDRARTNLGPRADQVQWIVANVTANPELGTVDVWHDRAVFHFLTRAEDRNAYVQLLRKCLVPGGYTIFATFAPDGPERCSGLEVCRYDSQTLAAELGAGFTLLKTVPETHHTPWGQSQSFQYSVFRRHIG